LLKRKLNIKFLLASFETHTNFEDFPESCIRISVLAFLLSHCRCSPVYLSWLAFGTIFMIAGGFQKNFLGSQSQAAIRSRNEVPEDGLG
jgi:hypothetical protein